MAIWLRMVKADQWLPTPMLTFRVLEQPWARACCQGRDCVTLTSVALTFGRCCCQILQKVKQGPHLSFQTEFRRCPEAAESSHAKYPCLRHANRYSLGGGVGRSGEERFSLFLSNRETRQDFYTLCLCEL